MKKYFETPELKIIELNLTDIIATSDSDSRGDEGNTGGYIPDAPFQ